MEKEQKMSKIIDMHKENLTKNYKKTEMSVNFQFEQVKQTLNQHNSMKIEEQTPEILLQQQSHR